LYSHSSSIPALFVPPLFPLSAQRHLEHFSRLLLHTLAFRVLRANPKPPPRAFFFLRRFPPPACPAGAIQGLHRFPMFILLCMGSLLSLAAELTEPSDSPTPFSSDPRDHRTPPSESIPPFTFPASIFWRRPYPYVFQSAFRESSIRCLPRTPAFAGTRCTVFSWPRFAVV